MQLNARGPALALALAALAVLVSHDRAVADELTGTWTGAVEVRGNYWWERSTRVVAPEISGVVAAPNGVRVEGRYLMDVITSASVAAGALVDVRFTEVRHDVTLGTGYEFDLGDAALDLSVRGRYSQEPDYSSLSGNVLAQLALADRASVLRLGVTGLHDEVGKIFRGANRVGDDGRDLSNRGKQGNLDALVLNLGYWQVLTRRLTIDVGYDLALSFGYLQNPYRQVSVAGVLMDERHPDERFRHTIAGRLAYYIEPTGTAIHAIYRAYLDSWDIAALSPEGRIYQEIGDLFVLRLRYRYYDQRRAFFQSDAGYTAADPYVTADPKMTDFHGHELGAQVLVHLDFLERSALDFAWRATIELGVDYVWRTNAFGNGIMGQAALRVPF